MKHALFVFQFDTEFVVSCFTLKWFGLCVFSSLYFLSIFLHCCDLLPRPHVFHQLGLTVILWRLQIMFVVICWTNCIFCLWFCLAWFSSALLFPRLFNWFYLSFACLESEFWISVFSCPSSYKTNPVFLIKYYFLLHLPRLFSAVRVLWTSHPNSILQ